MAVPLHFRGEAGTRPEQVHLWRSYGDESYGAHYWAAMPLLYRVNKYTLYFATPYTIILTFECLLSGNLKSYLDTLLSYNPCIWVDKYYRSYLESTGIGILLFFRKFVSDSSHSAPLFFLSHQYIHIPLVYQYIPINISIYPHHPGCHREFIWIK